MLEHNTAAIKLASTQDVEIAMLYDILLLLLLMSLIWRKFEIIKNAANAPCRLLQTL